MQRRQLLDRDGPRLEQPPKIGGKIGDRGLEEHPSAGLEHVSEPRDHTGLDAGGRILDERPQVRVRFNVSQPDKGRGVREQRHLRAVAANRRKRCEPIERAAEGSGRGPARV